MSDNKTDNIKSFDVGVIGAGIAGLTAALNLRRMGKSVIVLEYDTFGGQITHSPLVENFPCVSSVSGTELISVLFEQAENSGAVFELDRAIRIIDGAPKTIVGEDGKYLCKAIILATGAKPRMLGLAKEADFIGEGVSYCSLCDGAFYKDKEVAVVGGGNSALSEALNLSGICKKVYLIHRGTSFRAEKTVVERAIARENIQIFYSSKVTELLGEDTFKGIRIDRAEGEIILNVDAVFVAVGHVPNNDAFADVIKLDAQGYIISNEDCKTSLDGVFAAGDCRTKKIRQLTTAAADGAVAAEAAVNYIDNN